MKPERKKKIERARGNVGSILFSVGGRVNHDTDFMEHFPTSLV